MKTIGILGGMSWESTVSYYQLINREVNARLGGLHSAKICIRSVDFQEVADALRPIGSTLGGEDSNRNRLAELLIREAKFLEKGGADCLLIACNTVHKIADDVENAISIPLFHIADLTGEKLVRDGKKRVALLGTKFTMRQRFYRKRLKHRFGLDVLVPEPDDQMRVHNIIEEQLCKGSIRKEDREVYCGIIRKLQSRGAEAVILGCTEIGLLLTEGDSELPLYDTAVIQAKYAVEWALKDSID